MLPADGSKLVVHEPSPMARRFTSSLFPLAFNLIPVHGANPFLYECPLVEISLDPQTRKILFSNVKKDTNDCDKAE